MGWTEQCYVVSVPLVMINLSSYCTGLSCCIQPVLVGGDLCLGSPLQCLIILFSKQVRSSVPPGNIGALPPPPPPPPPLLRFSPLLSSTRFPALQPHSSSLFLSSLYPSLHLSDPLLSPYHPPLFFSLLSLILS